MAGKFGSGSAWLLVDGYNLIAAKLKSLTYKVEALLEPTTGLGDTWEEHTPTGMSKVTLAQDGGFFDTTATTGFHAAMSGATTLTPQSTPRVVCFGFAGHTIGESFVGIQGSYTNTYEVLASVGDLTKANATHSVTGQRDAGQILQPLAVKTADWETATSGEVDYTLDTSQRVIPITSNSIANPTVVTTAVPHGLTSGDIILIAGVITSDPTINGQRTATVTGLSTFTVPVNVTTGGTGGTIVRANSSNGGVGYLQVTDGSGFTNFVGTIRDSPDDITYTDLIAFTDSVLDPFAQRATVAGVVDRYLSFTGNVTGTGTITVFAGFSRS